MKCQQFDALFNTAKMILPPPPIVRNGLDQNINLNVKMNQVDLEKSF